MERKLVKFMLEGNDQFEIIGEAESRILNIRMPNKSGLDVVKEIMFYRQGKTAP
jgi:hypothetical protein